MHAVFTFSILPLPAKYYSALSRFQLSKYKLAFTKKVNTYSLVHTLVIQPKKKAF